MPKPRHPRTPSDVSPQHSSRHQWMDRAGVFAASACAVHCMLAPLVLAFAPLIGGIWSSPATHWVFAAVSLPAALSLLRRRLRGRSLRLRRWLAGLAFVGSSLVILGLSAPGAGWSQDLGIEVPCPEWMAPPSEASEASQCTDECCASVHTDSSGSSTFHLPFASIVTMLGGLFLVTAHALCLRGAKCCDPHRDS